MPLKSALRYRWTQRMHLDPTLHRIRLPWLSYLNRCSALFTAVYCSATAWSGAVINIQRAARRHSTPKIGRAISCALGYWLIRHIEITRAPSVYSNADLTMRPPEIYDSIPDELRTQTIIYYFSPARGLPFRLGPSSLEPFGVGRTVWEDSVSSLDLASSRGTASFFHEGWYNLQWANFGTPKIGGKSREFGARESLLFHFWVTAMQSCLRLLFQMGWRLVDEQLLITKVGKK